LTAQLRGWQESERRRREKEFLGACDQKDFARRSKPEVGTLPPVVTSTDNSQRKYATHILLW